MVQRETYMNKAKETKYQRDLRIAESQNGRKLFTRAVPDKRRKLLEKYDGIHEH